MTCRRCRKKIEEFGTRCPHCGDVNEKASGMFQTSTVMISAKGAERVYRSVDEVPAGLRTQLLKCTNGANSETILIVDRRGRQEIAKAMRNLPGPVQRLWIQSLMATDAASTAMEWITPARRRAIVVVIAVLTVAAVVLVFTRTG